MRKNNFLKIVLGVLFAAAALWLLWRGWHFFVGKTEQPLRPVPVTLWGAALIAWGWLLLFTIRHYRYF